MHVVLELFFIHIESVYHRNTYNFDNFDIIICVYVSQQHRAPELEPSTNSAQIR